MKPTLRRITIFAVLFLFSFSSVWAQKPPLPTGVVPDGLGYNIHFTHAKPGEMEMIAESGATIVRMDFHWGGTEREKGVYDFKAYDHLTDSLEQHKIRPLYILDYGNRHYDDGMAPCTDEGRKAFANWAAAAAVHFSKHSKDRGILWEMYNEPNIRFWKPEPNVEHYILLALEVGKALRQAAPNELYIGPATAQSPTLHTIDFEFLEKCFKAGLLEYWDAVSVHPYRQKDPETVLEEYARLRYLIDKYAPPNKKIPILSAEWGYSSVWHNFDDERQGKYLPRQWMINLACDVPVSIWYDWHDDGKDPKEPEHHFGTTNFEYKKDQTPVYDPKPAYVAAKVFNETFRGFRYNKRLWLDDPEVFVFLFDKEDKNVKLAAWTTSKEPKEITIPCVPGRFEAVSYLGEKLPDLTADENGLKLTITDGPVYLTPENNLSVFWQKVSKWYSEPLLVYGNSKLGGRGTTSGAAGVRMPNRLIPGRTRRLIEVQGRDFFQHSISYPTNPIEISLPIPVGKNMIVQISNPSGDRFGHVEDDYSSEFVHFADVEGLQFEKESKPFLIKQGETTATIVFPLKSAPADKYRFSLKVLADSCNDEHDYYAINVISPRTMKVLDDLSKYDTPSLNATWTVQPDGDKNVGSEQKLDIADGKLKLTFKYDDGWKFVRIFPKSSEARKLDGKPKALAFTVQGDGTPVSIHIRYRDGKGQTFQVRGGNLRDALPKNFEFPLDGRNASHWGGPNDGVITYPIQLDSIVVDGTRKACGPGTVTISSPVVIDE